MKKVIVASENPVKVAVAKRAFASVFPHESFEFIAMKSESGVPDQPINDETRKGALNRLNFIRANHPEGDFWISQEGGIVTVGDDLYTKAWIVICDSSGNKAQSASAEFCLPPKITEDIKNGKELAEATDRFFGSENSKHGLGAIGYLTDELITREDLYVQPAIIALSALKHKHWYTN